MPRQRKETALAARPVAVEVLPPFKEGKGKTRRLSAAERRQIEAEESKAWWDRVERFAEKVMDTAGKVLSNEDFVGPLLGGVGAAAAMYPVQVHITTASQTGSEWIEDGWPVANWTVTFGVDWLVGSLLPDIHIRLPPIGPIPGFDLGLNMRDWFEPHMTFVIKTRGHQLGEDGEAYARRTRAIWIAWWYAHVYHPWLLATFGSGAAATYMVPKLVQGAAQFSSGVIPG